MKLSPDFLLIRWNLAAFCAALILSGVLMYSSTEYADFTQANRRAAQRQIKDANDHLVMARQDRENLSDFSKEYAILQANKIIGDNHRLDWMEGLEKLRDQNLVVDFRYKVSPQKTYTPQPGIDSGNFEIHYSEMKLQFDLLHEGQLLSFFSALDKQIKGHFQLEGCSLERVSDDESTSPTSAINIKAECTGGWITLKNRNSPS